MLEIERKFLLRDIPNDLQNCEKQEITQGYFKHENQKDIRIRKTISYKKGRKCVQYTKTQKQGSGLVRNETEEKISEKDFSTYWETAKTYQIEKTRYFYPYKKYEIEINQFHNSLDGLRIAEIEFPSIEESNKFTPPTRCDKEITERKQANNSYLAVHGMKKLIEKEQYDDYIKKLQIKSFYNQQATKYSQTRKKHRNDAKIILDEIKKHNQKQIKILEIGCGSGRLLEHLQDIKKISIDYTGIDISENILEEAKKIPERTNIKRNFICGDMIDILGHTQQEEYDIIIGIASLQHLTSQKQRFLAAKYIYRSLKYEGSLILTNRSFSSRMLKKHWKPILNAIREKCLHPSRRERNDLMIPRTSDKTTYHRFYHIFTPKELKHMFTQGGFTILKQLYLTKQGEPTYDRKNSSNTLLIAKKTIFKDSSENTCF